MKDREINVYDGKYLSTGCPDDFEDVEEYLERWLKTNNPNEFTLMVREIFNGRAKDSFADVSGDNVHLTDAPDFMTEYFNDVFRQRM